MAAVLVLLAAWGCAPAPERSDTPTLVVTIFPLADLAQRMVGDDVRVVTLLPPRASPATWEATPRQVRSLAGARGYVRVGGGLDTWLTGFEGDLPTLVLTEGMELREAEHAHGGHEEGEEETATGDPHVWLDPILVREALLPRMEVFLTELFPENAPGIHGRSLALADTLERLHQEIHGTLRASPQRHFVATHEAWAYFASRYGLESLGSIYERPGHEPSARGIAALVRAARQAGVTVVLAEPQLAESGARALAQEMGARVMIVDPLGGPGLSGRESYTEMMHSNARAFARALGGS